LTFLTGKTPKTFAQGLASLRNQAWLPAALLLLALSSVFLFGGDRAYFYKDDASIGHSAKVLAIADNLSDEHRFRMFVYQTLDEDGKIVYEPYNRFPIGGFALIKLAILPFGNDLSAKIYAARMLMLLFFAAAAVLAYLSLCRLASNRWIALTATLTAFSSAYCLYYSDMIFNEAVIDLFAVMLGFHGMMIFEQEARFRQLSIKACIALLLGWHVYALLLPFIAFGLMRELIKAQSGVSAHHRALRRIKCPTLALIRSRYLALGVVTLLFGISVLTFNFTNEYFALNRETPLTELPSLQSLTIRTGVEPYLRETYDKYLSLPNFLERQFYRIGMMSLPHAFSPTYTELSLSYVRYREALPRSFIILGIAAFGASLIGLPFIRRYKILLASLALSGFCWALLVRGNTAFPWHNHEGLFYIGVALTLFSLVLLRLRALSGERLIATLSVAALLIFALSAWRMAQLNNPNRTSEFHKVAIADFESIRNVTDPGKAIWINSIMQHHDRRIADYYLTGRVIAKSKSETRSMRSPIDFVVTDARAYGLASLTPQNRMLFLYEWDDLNKHINQTITQSGEPLIRSDFDVYHDGGMLVYVKDDCSEDDISEKFFLAVHPADESALSDERRQHGFDDFSFNFQERAVQRNERCIAIAPLPDYIIDHIHTGQYIDRADGSYEHTWEWNGKIHRSLSPTILASLDETIEQADKPLIRSDFDVYLSDNNLIYVKDACSADDAEPRFFLAVYPADESDLPDERRRHGYDNIDFRFQDQGVRRGERCIAIAPLPNYAINHINTGQYIHQADGSFEHTWESVAVLPEAAN